MFARLIQICSAFLFASALAASSPVFAGDDGIIAVKSAYPIGETIERLKRDIADKGIKFFDEIDQSKLAADAGITLRPSVLLIFGNPPLGTQFITANANAGLDQCGFSSTKMRNARCGLPTPSLIGSHGGMELKTERINSTWHRA